MQHTDRLGDGWIAGLGAAPAQVDLRVCNVPHHCCAECNLVVADLPGAAHLMLVDEVVYLEPGPAVFAAMLEAWARQQRTRGLAADTVRGRAALVRRLYEFRGIAPNRIRPPTSPHATTNRAAHNAGPA